MAQQTSCRVDSTLGLARMSIDGRWARFERPFLTLLGYTAGGPDHGDHTLIHAHDVRRIRLRVARLLAGASRAFHLHARFRTPRGAFVRLRLLGVLVRDFFGQPTYVQLQIRPPRVRAARSPRLTLIEGASAPLESQELAPLIGVPASAMHELAQPLTAITLNAFAARQALAKLGSSPALLSEILEDITESAERAADMLRDLRALPRIGSSHAQAANRGRRSRSAHERTRAVAARGRAL